jgi:peptide chain release factor 1
VKQEYISRENIFFIKRVIRVPETENKGRLHSSTCSVVVLPKGLEEEFSLSMRDLKFEYMRSSGPGG